MLASSALGMLRDGKIGPGDALAVFVRSGFWILIRGILGHLRPDLMCARAGAECEPGPIDEALQPNNQTAYTGQVG